MFSQRIAWSTFAFVCLLVRSSRWDLNGPQNFDPSQKICDRFVDVFSGPETSQTHNGPSHGEKGLSVCQEMVNKTIVVHSWRLEEDTAVAKIQPEHQLWPFHEQTP
jgi:hypothetical protein